MNKYLHRVKEPKKYDYILIVIVGLLVCCSLVAIYSSLKQLQAYQSNIVFTQFRWVLISLVAVGVILYFGNESLYDFIEIIYKILLVLLIILFIDMVLFKLTGRHLPGGLIDDINGAISWYNIPGLGSLQPSEFMKIVLVIKTALIINEHNENKTENSYEEDIQLFIKIAKLCALPLILILLQPDTGLVMIIGISIVLMVLCSGIRKEWFLVFFTAIVIIVLLFLYLYFYQRNILNIFLQDHQLRRFDGWFYPEESVLEDGHQLYTSLLALGSAGLTGVGLQPTTIQLSEANTDLIFVIFGQSFGLVGSLFLLCLCFLLDYRIYRIIVLSDNAIEKYMMCGFLGMIVYQQIQNIGMVVGLLPITGITLPFVSYGGSSLLSYFIALGFILNASSKAKKLSDYVYD
ncbi:FtsW/RodA/SpoVE family cell cycle protein [uncultured Traorella sp.]|uniref:FtsW/RodA/SpoVE family cell cycle protein n=1 Tax=uncultured Traorella sp. TaxID=1929048 RepID=UPI0025F65896|nr:FtsW/RodA/SpoVE family cell cycle protein [uncultured Traorella sp.]